MSGPGSEYIPVFGSGPVWGQIHSRQLSHVLHILAGCDLASKNIPLPLSASNLLVSMDMLLSADGDPIGAHRLVLVVSPSYDISFERVYPGLGLSWPRSNLSTGDRKLFIDV